MKYIKKFEKRRYIKVGDYLKLFENKGYNNLPFVKVLDGSDVFKNTHADYYVKLFLHNLNNPEMNFESRWVDLWISKSQIERVATKEEFEKQNEIISLILVPKKYNL